jgi:hypothetical protein
MSKEQKDNVRVIEFDQRLPELEELVKYYTQNTPDLPWNEILHKRVVIQDFEDLNQKRAFEIEEVKRCKYGHEGMCGKMYFYFNYIYIQNLKGGKIFPEYRQADNEWFARIEDAQKSEEYGFICVKRRRAGASWKEAADVIHDVIFNRFFHIGLNSKSDRDSEILFKKIMFVYENLPAFLKAKIGSKAGMKVEFFRLIKDELDQKKKAGNQSSLIVVPPTDSAYEGMMLNKWVCDEAGKIKNLPQIWSFTEDCLMQETVRVGCPVIFGTSGEVGKDGAGLMTLWNNAEAYKLKRFFFAGWMGLITDQYGNDMKEDSIRYIIYERARRSSLDAKTYNDFIQKYPLTVEEAFSQSAGNGIGDMKLINRQLHSLRENPPVLSRGIFHFDEDWNVTFIPKGDGPVIIYEHPIKGLKDAYIGGSDPADHDDVGTQASDLSMHIIKKATDGAPPITVLEYVDRPAKVQQYYNQSIAALIYFNNAKILIERNRYRMISYYDDMSFKHLLATTPQGITRLLGGRTVTIGVHMNETIKEYLAGLIESYIDENVEYMWSKELLQECVDYGTRNTDRIISFGLALMLLKDSKGKVKTNQVSMRIPTFSYKKINGKIVRVQGR